jgi:HEAT repeat protein
VRAIGTNAFSFLISMIRSRQTGGQSLGGVAAKVRKIFRLRGDSDYERNWEGADGFVILGPTAWQATSMLGKAFEDNISPSSQFAAASALAGIGQGASNAVPTLIRAATNSDAKVRFHAIFALNGIHAASDQLVPLLVQALKDPSADVRSVALTGLGDLGPAAVLAVATIGQLIESSDPGVRRLACGALGNIHSEPERSIPLLVRCFSDSSPVVRGEAAWAVGNFGAAGSNAVDSFRELLQDNDQRIHSTAQQSLKKIAGQIE